MPESSIFKICVRRGSLRRYLFEPTEASAPSPPYEFDQVAIPVDVPAIEWISLDTLARYLIQAETRMRRHVQVLTVRQSVFRLEGALQESAEVLNIEQDLGGHNADPGRDVRRNILAIRILNLGDSVGLRLNLQSPEPSGTYAPTTPQNPQMTHAPDPLWKALSVYDLLLSYEYLPPTATALAAEVPVCTTQFLNRDLNGILKATITKGEATSQNVSLRIEVWHS